MQNLVELNRNEMVDLRDAGVDHHLGVPGDRHRSVQELRYEFLDQVLAAFERSRFFPETSFLDNLIEQASFEYRFASRRCLRSLLISHCLPPSPFASSDDSICPYRPLGRGALLPAYRCLAGYHADPIDASASPGVPSKASPGARHFPARSRPCF